MGWFKKIPKLSLLLLIATYGVFGWLYSVWSSETLVLLSPRYPWLAARFFTFITYDTVSFAVGAIAIITLVTCFTAPIALLTLGMNNWLRFDAKAVASIAITIAIFALVVEYPAVLVRLLVLSAAAMLFSLDMQTLGYSKRMSRVILLFLCLVSFTSGVLLYHYET